MYGVLETKAPMDTRPFVLHRRQMLAASLGAVVMAMQPGAQAAEPRKGDALTISFRGTSFVHRWSKDGQHEFTPQGEADLKAWRDMVTFNVHEAVTQGEQLATVANKVLGNYQQHGKILQTRSVPRTPERPAEHLIVAVLGTPQLLEAVFARCLLRDGTGMIAVVSHRVYGKGVGPEMSDWLKANGPQVEQALMAWAPLPGVATLKRLNSVA